MSVVAWVCDEYDARLSTGKSAGEAAAEVLALVFEFGRTEELARACGVAMIQYLYSQELRHRRRVLAVAESVTESRPALMPESQPSLGAELSMHGVEIDDFYNQPYDPRQVAEPELAPSRVFGAPRIDRNQLRRSTSIFYAEIPVGERPMRYGAMTITDWEIKNAEYKIRADNATARHWACQNIIERLTPGMTTEQCMSEEEFKRLIPDIGF